MYRYEMHLHTSPVSKCARATVRETLEFYSAQRYDGVFITNHFIKPKNDAQGRGYEELIEFFFSDYEEALALSTEMGIKVFSGAEISFAGNHFLVYGLEKEWYLAHPDILDMPFSDMLTFMRSEGAFITHAHPFDERGFIDHIKLLPRCVDAVEIVNAHKTEFQNAMANIYATAYGLIRVAGSDNHGAGRGKRLSGVECEEPIVSIQDFIAKAKAGMLTPFDSLREEADAVFVDQPIHFKWNLSVEDEE